MCNINTIGLGLETVNNISSTTEKYQQNQMQFEYKKARNNAILNSLKENSKELNNSYAADYAENALKRQQNYIKNLQAKARFQAAAASSGLTGNSVENLYMGYERAGAVNNYLSARNLQTIGYQYNDRLNALRTSAIRSISTQYPYQNNMAPIALNSVNGLFNVFKKAQNYNNENL